MTTPVRRTSACEWFQTFWQTPQKGRFKAHCPTPTSILDTVGKEPARFQLIIKGMDAIKRNSMYCAYATYENMSKFGSSLSDIFLVQSAWKMFEKADAATLARFVAPYALTACALTVSDQIAERTQVTLGVLYLAYSILGRWTEQLQNRHGMVEMAHRTMSIWSLSTLHQLSYHQASRMSDGQLTVQYEEGLITEDTRDSINLLAGLAGTCIILPQAILMTTMLVNQQIKKWEQTWGRGTQSSRSAALPNGRTAEMNFALLTYNHLVHRFSDPAFLFSTFIVSLNVLKDVDVQDPAHPPAIAQEGWGRIAKRTRNVWLLAAESFLKAKNELKIQLGLIAADRANHAKKYKILRNGIPLCVNRYQVEVGDLIALEDTLIVVHDQLTGTTRMKAGLSGYLLQTPQGPAKKVAISLAELNGENKPVLLSPERSIEQLAKLKKERTVLDLFTVPSTGAIFPGTEFLSFDNGNPQANAEGLFLQIAPVPEVSRPSAERIPFSAKDSASVKTGFIRTVLALSSICGLSLMEYHKTSLSIGKLLQYYTAEFIHKFTQVFVHMQTFVPLTNEVMLQLINNELLKDINGSLKEKLSINQALCIADLFEFLRQGKVRFFSDKTGTITETFMVMKKIVFKASPKKVLVAFATTFSDEKTEAEENEAREYYSKQGEHIFSFPIPGRLGYYRKVIENETGERLEFVTRTVGLFTDFGGKFTLREQQGLAPVLVFCGVPKEGGEGSHFGHTPLLAAYRDYERTEQQADSMSRQDSLTRDWCIAETPLSSANYKALMDALAFPDLAVSKHKTKEVLQKLRNEWNDYLAIFQIDNFIKRGAKAAIQEWNKAGILFRIITGDTVNAAKMLSIKLFPNQSATIYEAQELPHDWKTQDLSASTVIFTDTQLKSLSLFTDLEALKKPPNIIFCQMKDTDKAALVMHSKAQGNFIIANGDGSNDLLMLNAADIPIGDAAHDGSFARGVREASIFTDTQLRELMGRSDSSFYESFDLQKRKDSLFLRHLAPLANTQPKVITALAGKALKSVAIPSALGLYTQEIPGQFGILLGYDALFLAATYQASLATARTPFVDQPISQSSLPRIVLLSAISLGAAQSAYCYCFHDQKITTCPLLLANLALSVASLKLFLAPPGYAIKKKEASQNMSIEEKKHQD